MGKKTKSKFVKLTKIEEVDVKDEVIRLLAKIEEVELKKKDMAKASNDLVKDHKNKLKELCHELRRGREVFEGEEKK